MAAHVKDNEPGAQVYELTISEDGGTGHVNERYRDSAAGLAHMESFGKNFAARLFALAKPTGMFAFGEPDAALKGRPGPGPRRPHESGRRLYALTRL